MTLTTRAWRLCSDRTLLEKEIDILKDIFISSGYPVEIVDGGVTQRSIPRLNEQEKEKENNRQNGIDEEEKKDDEERNEEEVPVFKMFVPYVPGIFETLKKELA